MKLRSISMAQNEETLRKIKDEMHYLFGKELQDSLYTDGMHNKVKDYLKSRLMEESSTSSWFPYIWFDDFPMIEFKVNTDIVKEEDKVKIKVNLSKVNQEVNKY